MLTVNLDTPQRQREFEAGLAGTPNVAAVCVDPSAFLRSGEVDAQYLSLTYAERFGSRPIPPHTVAVLRTAAADQEQGWPPFIVTGLILNSDSEDSPAFVIPVLAKAISALPEVQDGRIRTIGIGERFLCWGGASLSEVGVLVASEFGSVGTGK